MNHFWKFRQRGTLKAWTLTRTSLPRSTSAIVTSSSALWGGSDSWCSRSVSPITELKANPVCLSRVYGCGWRAVMCALEMIGSTSAHFVRGQTRSFSGLFLKSETVRPRRTCCRHVWLLHGAVLWEDVCCVEMFIFRSGDWLIDSYWTLSLVVMMQTKFCSFYRSNIKKKLSHFSETAYSPASCSAKPLSYMLTSPC